MDSLAAPAQPRDRHPGSSNLQLIEAAFDVSVQQGFMAGLEALLEIAREDCEFRPYIASGDVLRGPEEVRGFYRSAASAGTDMRLRPATFHEDGDTVIVNGTMRVARPSGGFSESQISWRYSFRDGRLAGVSWSPRRIS
jgi:ketosteroid isomerase-like protein